MTRTQFDQWQRQMGAPHVRDCPECWKLHVLRAHDYFLAGERERPQETFAHDLETHGPHERSRR